MAMTGAQALIECLKRENVEIIFGIPGGVLLPVYDVLYDAPIRHILTRHEQGAAHMADGYARASGKVGVCLATSGPGATNLTTGLCTAHMDSIPVVAITGQVPTYAIGRDSFQEADTFSISMPFCKHNYLVKDVALLPRIVAEAFYIARTGRPGPVLIDLPRDVSQATLDDLDYPDKISIRSYRPAAGGHPIMIRRAADLLNEAQRPVIYCGGGIIASGAHEEIAAIARKINAPITNTLMGKGAFPETDVLSLGMPGMHGTAYANYALNDADVILAAGVRFDDRVTGKVETFAQKARFIHIDVDPAEIGKTVKVEVPIVGDAKKVLAELVELLKPAEHAEWLATVEGWKKKYPLRWRPDGVKPQEVVQRVYEETKGDAIVTTDVGQHQMWAAQYYLCTRPRQFLSSGGLGTMGYGFPAAIGAQFAKPDAVVWCFAGDGSFMMNLQEMGTAVEHKLPVKVAIMNNGYLGMVRQWQELFFKRRYSGVNTRPGQPDFVKLAEAFGARGARVDKPEQIVPAIRQAAEYKDGPFLIDFRIEQEENVMPMVPAGGSIDQMMVD
jgi:acetolactate synthase-1/2/3 large subunit